MRWVVVTATVMAVLGAAAFTVSPRSEGRPAGPALAAQERGLDRLGAGALELAREELPRLRPVPPPHGLFVPEGVPVPPLPRGEGYVCPVAGCPDADPCLRLLRPGAPSREPCRDLPRRGERYVDL